MNRRVSRDDSKLRKDLEELEWDSKALRNKQTMTNVRTFTAGLENDADKAEQAKIFADNLDIAQSPAKIVVDNSDSKNDDKNLLDDIMNEEESEEESKKSEEKKQPVKEFNEDDEISDGERKRILDEIDLDSDEDNDDDEDESSEASVV